MSRFFGDDAKKDGKLLGATKKPKIPIACENSLLHLECFKSNIMITLITLLVPSLFRNQYFDTASCERKGCPCQQVPVAKMLRKDDPILGPAAKTSGFKDVTLELLLTNRGGCWGVTRRVTD